MNHYEVIPLVSRVASHPHPYVPNHSVESIHVDMWGVRNIETKEVVDKHWHKESCEEVAKWYELDTATRGEHPCLNHPKE